MFRGVITNPSSENQYTYVENDPCRWTDPWGLDAGAPSKTKCGNPPPLAIPLAIPSDVDLAANVKLAWQHPLWTESFPTGDLVPNVPAALWLYERVKPEGIWDFKDQFPPNPAYEPFGNWHFGVVGTAQGWDEAGLLRGAGWAQQRDNPSVGQGQWWSGAPYGDDPRDQAWIRAGVQFYSWYACILS